MLFFVLGGEGVGVIIELGDGVEGFKIGDCVCFNGLIGVFVLKVVLLVGIFVKIFDSMFFEEVVGLIVVYVIFYYVLK